MDFPRFFSLTAFALAMAVVVGCGAKPEEAKPGTQPLEPAPAAESGPSYTIKLRELKAGDKLEVTQTQTSTMKFYIAKTQKTQTQKVSFRTDFTETILAKPVGAAIPTKLTRHYKVAELTKDAEKAKPEPYQGKTVTIEENIAGGPLKYTYKMKNGKPVRLKDAGQFENEEAFRIQDVMPKSPVRVGETWKPEGIGTDKLLHSLGIPGPDPTKSSVTGRLVKVFDRDGKQWADIEFAIEAADTEGSGTGQLIFEAPIDGSSLELTQKVHFAASLPKWDGSTTITISETRKPVK